MNADNRNKFFLDSDDKCEDLKCILDSIDEDSEELSLKETQLIEKHMEQCQVCQENEKFEKEEREKKTFAIFQSISSDSPCFSTEERTEIKESAKNVFENARQMVAENRLENLEEMKEDSQETRFSAEKKKFSKISIFPESVTEHQKHLHDEIAGMSTSSQDTTAHNASELINNWRNNPESENLGGREFCITLLSAVLMKNFRDQLQREEIVCSDNDKEICECIAKKIITNIIIRYKEEMHVILESMVNNVEDIIESYLGSVKGIRNAEVTQCFSYVVSRFIHSLKQELSNLYLRTIYQEFFQHVVENKSPIEVARQEETSAKKEMILLDNIYKKFALLSSCE